MKVELYWGGGRWMVVAEDDGIKVVVGAGHIPGRVVDEDAAVQMERHSRNQAASRARSGGGDTPHSAKAENLRCFGEDNWPWLNQMWPALAEPKIKKRAAKQRALELTNMVAVEVTGSTDDPYARRGATQALAGKPCELPWFATVEDQEIYRRAYELTQKILLGDTAEKI